MPSDHALASVLVQLSDTLVDDFDMVEFLHRVCGHAVTLFGVGAAGVLLIDSGRLRVVAASSEQAELIELFQIQRDQGPCLDCHRDGQPVLADTPDELQRRWPAFGERIRGDFASAYAFPMRLRGEALGTLNLFGRDPHALGENDVPLCQALADIATISLLQDRALRHATVVADQLQHALDSRVTIEQAKGKLAERRGIDVGEALEVLREHARRRNAKLRDVAAAVLHDRVDFDAN